MVNRSLLLSVALYGLLAAPMVGSWIFVNGEEQKAIEAELAITSHQVARRLEGYIDNHLERVARLRETIPLEEELFHRLADGYRKRNPGLQALNFVDVSGIIRWVSPEVGNRGAKGFDLSLHPVAGPTFLAARESSELHVTPPHELLQGGWGITAYQRIEDETQVYGLVNTVFRLPDLLASCLDGDNDARFSYELRSGKQVLAFQGIPQDQHSDRASATAKLNIHGHGLDLFVIRPPMSAASSTLIDEGLLAMSLLLAAALVAMLRVAQRRQRLAEMRGERLRNLLEYAPDAILTMELESGRIIGANPQAFHLFGYEGDDFLDLSRHQLSPPEQIPGTLSEDAFQEQLAVVRNGEPAYFEWNILNQADQTKLTEIRMVSLPNDGGQELLRLSITDVSERVDLESRLHRTQVHEAIGQLAGGVAHDFNNMLTAILGASELLAERSAGDIEAVDLARGAADNCRRAAKLTQRLLAFSRGTEAENEAVDINQVIIGLLPMLKRVISERIELKTDLRASSSILANSGQLELALLNLVVNARDAMPDGGVITITSESPTPSSVTMCVEDEGQGIPKNVIDRVFEPFFTTKDPNVGTGIGLATVRQIIDQAGGRINVESRMGMGTKFIVEFPAYNEEPIHILTPQPAPLPKGAGVVLIVEDNPEVREIVNHTLKAAGFETLSAASGEEAVAIGANTNQAIDLLITDSVLPGVSGLEVVQAMHVTRPELRALLISGYPNLEPMSPEQQVEWLAKPFSPTTLLERVNKVLSEDWKGTGAGHQGTR